MICAQSHPPEALEALTHRWFENVFQNYDPNNLKALSNYQRRRTFGSNTINDLTKL